MFFKYTPPNEGIIKREMRDRNIPWYFIGEIVTLIPLIIALIIFGIIYPEDMFFSNLCATIAYILSIPLATYVALRFIREVRSCNPLIIYRDGFVPPSPIRSWSGGIGYIRNGGRKVHFDEIESIAIFRSNPQKKPTVLKPILVLFIDIPEYRRKGYYEYSTHYAEPYFMSHRMPIPDTIFAIMVKIRVKKNFIDRFVDRHTTMKPTWTGTAIDLARSVFGFFAPKDVYIIQEDMLEGISCKDLLKAINDYYGGEIWRVHDDEILCTRLT